MSDHRPGSRRWAALAAFVLVTSALVAIAPPASALTTATIRVIIDEVRQQGCTDSTTGSDFFAYISIGPDRQLFGQIDDQDNIAPDWKMERILDVDTQSPVTVMIDLWDLDGGFNFGNDHCDISPVAGTILVLVIPLVNCRITEQVELPCNTQVQTVGNGDGDGNALIRFRIEVDEPAAAPGLTVRCLHEPLWPQPGDNVTVTAEALEARSR